MLWFQPKTSLGSIDIRKDTFFPVYFRFGLRDLFEAELQTIKLLPVLLEAVHDGGLQRMVEGHLRGCGQRLRRLEMILDALDEAQGEGTCEALQDVVRHAKRKMVSKGNDTSLLAVFEVMGEYKIVGYLASNFQALELGFDEAAGILQESLREEGCAQRELGRHCNRLQRLANTETRRMRPVEVNKDSGQRAAGVEGRGLADPVSLEENDSGPAIQNPGRWVADPAPSPAFPFLGDAFRAGNGKVRRGIR